MDKDIIRFICNNFCLFCKWNCCCYSVKCAGLSKFNRNYMSLLKIARPFLNFSRQMEERDFPVRDLPVKGPSRNNYIAEFLVIDRSALSSFQWFPILTIEKTNWSDICMFPVFSFFFHLFFSFSLIRISRGNYGREFSEFLEHRSQGNPR